MFGKLAKYLNKETKDGKKYYYTLVLIGVLIVGVAMTTLSTRPKPDPNNQVIPVAKTTTEELSYEEAVEERLAKILQKMDGVGEVDVMLTTDATKEKVLAQDYNEVVSNTEEKDQGGGTRTSKQEDKKNKVVMQQGNVPYVVKENKPQIQGVLVLAEGGEMPEVKSAIIESVSSLLNVSVHKISVFKMVKN